MLQYIVVIKNNNNEIVCVFVCELFTLLYNLPVINSIQSPADALYESWVSIHFPALDLTGYECCDRML